MIAKTACFVLLIVQSYCAAVYLVRQFTPSDLLSQLKQNGIRHPDHTRALSQFSCSLCTLFFSVLCDSESVLHELNANIQ